MNTKTILSNCKNIFAVAALTLGIGVPALAQDAAFNKGSKTLGFSAGVPRTYGYYNYYGGNFVNLPALALTYDQGFFEDVGPGTIGIGGLIGFQTSYYKYNYYYSGYGNQDYRVTYTNFIVGVRGTYHLTILKDKNNKFDPYAGIMAGLRIFKYKDNDPNDYYEYNYNSVYPVTGAFIGAKYNVAEHFGFFAEVGYDISFARIGFNINF